MRIERDTYRPVCIWHSAYAVSQDNQRLGGFEGRPVSGFQVQGMLQDLA